jgi:hypothetical protein
MIAKRNTALLGLWSCLVMGLCLAAGCQREQVHLTENRIAPPANIGLDPYAVPLVVHYSGAEWMPMQSQGLAALINSFLPLGCKAYHYPYGRIITAATEEMAYKGFVHPEKLTGERLVLEITADTCVLQSSGPAAANDACEFKMIIKYELIHQGPNGERKIEFGGGEYHAQSAFDGTTTPAAVYRACYESVAALAHKIKYSNDTWRFAIEMTDRASGRETLLGAAGTIKVFDVRAKNLFDTGVLRPIEDGDVVSFLDTLAKQVNEIADALVSKGLKGRNVAVLPSLDTDAETYGYGRLLAGWLQDALLKRGVNVISREHVEELTKEKNLRMSDLVKKPDLPSEIKEEKIDYIIGGDVKIIQVGHKPEK